MLTRLLAGLKGLRHRWGPRAVCCISLAAVAFVPAARPAVASVAQDFSPAVGAIALPSDLSTLQIRVGFLKPGGGYAVTTMPLETYVARVLAGEAARNSPPAALEALAIAIRTYAVANLGRHGADGFDLCDQTHCQVVRASSPATERAADATAGRVLLHDGALASIYYSASCGGRTEIPSAVWPGAEDPPYLPSQRDDACEGTPAWTADIELRDLQRALRQAGFRGTLRGVRVAARDRSGRVAQLRLDGLTPDVISGQNLRVAVGRTLGWLLIKSTAFELSRRGTVYRLDGHGSGHGVGLCVIGSTHLAAAGVSADAILHRYYPGLDIVNATRRVAAAPATRPAVTLPDEDAGEQPAIAAIERRARDDLSRALGLAPPRPIAVRVHPTIESYEAATGQPSFTDGALAGGEIHLVPLATLQARGMLERTIRRELVRAMTADALAKRASWVRIGAALYFADPPGAVTRERPPRVECPSDAELAEPVSVGALSNAWARARACFARQIADGRSWRDVR